MLRPIRRRCCVAQNRCAAPTATPCHRRRLRAHVPRHRHDRPAARRRSTTRSPRRRRPGEAIEVAPRHPLAADAAAVRARPHQPVAARRRRRRRRWSTAATATPRRARCGSGISRRRSRGRPLARIIATHCHPDHVGNAAWLAARFGCPVAMTAGRIPDRARDRRRARRLRRRRRRVELFRAARHGRRAPRGAATRAATSTGAACRSCRQSFDAAARRRPRRAGGDDVARRSRATAIRPSTRRSTRRELGVLISGDMLLPRISTNVSVWPAEPDGDPLGALPRFARRVRRAAAPTRWCCRRTGCRSAASPLRVAQLRAHHAARLAELAAAVAAAPRR